MGLLRTTRWIRSVDLFAVSCLFLMVESQRGQILPPQNVSVLWVSGFELQLSWAPPQHSMENCRYEVVSKKMEGEESTYGIKKSPKLLFIVMEGGFLHLSVKTVCNGIKSEPVSKNITYPDLVKNFECYVHASERTRCSWLPNSHAPDLRFFYRLLREDFSVSVDNKPSYHIQECPSYRHTSGVRTGCDVEAGINHSIQVLFNGTLNNTLVRNTFKKMLLQNVRPPPLKWTVTKTGDKLNISWTPPDIRCHWTYTIKYTECDETKALKAEDVTSVVLDLVPQCPYNMTIKARTNGGETPWSSSKHFDADTNPYAFVYAAFILPLMFAGLVVLMFVCCRKNKENILPKVPVPRDLLSDISDNNNKINVRNLYVPAEEEDCKITLVVDDQINKPAL